MSSVAVLKRNPEVQAEAEPKILAHTAVVTIEDIPIDVFPSRESMLDRIIMDIRQPYKARIFSLNIHGANMAHKHPQFKKIMQNAETMICDGVGIIWASRLLPGLTIPCRHAAGDFMPALLKRLAQEGMTAYFLAGQPGIAEKALENLALQCPGHTVIGIHHGYILNDKRLENKVIAEINRLKPDILFVGFGMPLQEYWIEKNLPKLQVKAFFPFGATLDYISREVPRCPSWLAHLGLEWLFRFCLEPIRMFERYIMGNPFFFLRIVASLLQNERSTTAPTFRPHQ